MEHTNNADTSQEDEHNVSLHIVAPVPINIQDNTSSGMFADSRRQNEGEVWCKSCTLGDPIVIRGNNSGKYTVWTISFYTLRGTKIIARRRYNDFVKFKDQLNSLYSQATYIPELPPKTYFYQNRFGAHFLEKRRKSLEFWLNSVILNPKLSATPEVKNFALAN